MPLIPVMRPKLSTGEKVMLDPILVGRNGPKIEEIARRHGIERWSTDLDAALALARTWPMLELPGTSVEVRPMVTDYSQFEQ